MIWLTSNTVSQALQRLEAIADDLPANEFAYLFTLAGRKIERHEQQNSRPEIVSALEQIFGADHVHFVAASYQAESDPAAAESDPAAGEREPPADAAQVRRERQQQPPHAT